MKTIESEAPEDGIRASSLASFSCLSNSVFCAWAAGFRHVSHVTSGSASPGLNLGQFGLLVISLWQRRTFTTRFLTRAMFRTTSSAYNRINAQDYHRLLKSYKYVSRLCECNGQWTLVAQRWVLVRSRHKVLLQIITRNWSKLKGQKIQT